MTWQQFRDEVERQMEQKEISQDEQIFYIDIGWKDKVDDVQVVLDPDAGLKI